MAETVINLPVGHDPVMHNALIWLEESRKTGKNFLNIMTGIRDDIVHMELTDKERDLFELGAYVVRLFYETQGEVKQMDEMWRQELPEVKNG